MKTLTAGVSVSSILVNRTDDSKANSWYAVDFPAQTKDDVLLSRKLVNANDKTGLGLRLYQYQTCPFCSKVRALLDYYGLSYEVVEVNPVTRNQIKFSKNYKKVPIVTSKDSQVLTESSLVVSVLATFLHLQGKRSLKEVIEFYPSLEFQDPKSMKMVNKHPNKYFIMNEERQMKPEELQNAREEREWREWVDDHFIHLISPNVYRTWKESLETFHWFSEAGEWERNFPAWERYLAIYVGALAMFMLSKRLKVRHNIEDERKSMRDACEKWMSAVGKNRLFLGGKEPNLADIELYGAITSFRGCTAFLETIAGTPMGEWFERVHKAVENHAGQAILKNIVTKK